MTTKIPLLVLLSLFLGGLVACRPQETEALPTLASINIPATTTPIPVSTIVARPTLPATFTPTPIRPTDLPLPTATQNSMEEIPTLSGTIYYIYNGDSIIALSPDGINNTLVMTFGVDKPISDLAASPDGSLITFVAPGNGTAQEVYVMNRDGSYLQQISCLGFQNVRQPIFTPDGTALVWFAAPSVDEAGNIYRATLAGSNNCPTDNNQSLFVRTENMQFNGMAWNRLGDLLFYVTQGDLLEFDPITQNTTIAFGQSGITPNNSPSQNPTSDQLIILYARSETDGLLNTQAELIADSTKGQVRTVEDMGLMEGILDVKWSLDGTYLVVATRDGVYLRYNETGKIDIIAQEITNPIAVISPDNTAVAYLRVDRRGIAQWHIFVRETEVDTRITSNTEGTISDVLWLP